MRVRVQRVGPLVLLLVCGIAPLAHAQAQWGPNGIAVPGGRGGAAHVIPDGEGGALIGWSDARAYPANREDVYAQHLTAAGTLAPGCPTEGMPVCTTPLAQYFTSMASDGQGGAFLGWFDFRIPGNGYTACVQRVTPDGAIAAGWPVDGTPVSTLGSTSSGPLLVPDGEGGALCLWTDIRNHTDDDLYAQHLMADGSVAPGWPATGLPVAVYPGYQFMTRVASDNAGGLVAAWFDGRPGAKGIYMQHLRGDGTLAPGWPEGGRYIAGPRALASMVSDGAEGFYLGIYTNSYQYTGMDSTYYVLRVDAEGQRMPGWAEDGTLVCAAPEVRTGPRLASDAAGEVFLSWDDYRGIGYSRTYLTKLLADGTLAPGWVANGVPVCTYPGYQFNGDLLADGSGGAYVTGTFQNGSYAYMQHYGSDGAPAPGWDADGELLYPQGAQYDPRMATDGAGGAIVVWENDAAGFVYAQRFAGESPTATLLSLVSAAAQTDRVELLWQGEGALGVAATIERCTAMSEWQNLGAPVAEGADRLRYEDRDVVAGTRYGYRLRYEQGGTSSTTTETWVDVPAAASFALVGLCPNPSSGANLKVAFTLAESAPATLELIDVAGRRIAVRELSGLGAGAHVEPLQPEAKVPAGLYWLRLTQGTRSRVARAVVTG